MTDLSPGWEWARLDDIAEVRLGRQRSPKNHTGSQMRPYLRAANVNWRGLRLDDVKMMNFTDEEANIYRLEYGDVVVAEASGSPGEVGKPALWRSEIDGCCLQNTLIRVRSLGAVEPVYLMHFIRAEALRGAFAEKSRGVGIYHLGSARLAEWLIPVPPLAEQRRIVDALEGHLSRLDAGLRSIDSARSHFLRLRHAELVSIRDLASSRSGALTPLVEVADTSLGKMIDAKRNSGILTPYLRNANVQWGEFDLDDVSEAPMSEKEIARLSLRKGDLMVCEGGQPGRCAVWQDSEKMMTYQKALHRVRPREGALACWLSLMIEEAVRSGRTTKMLTGTTIKHLPQDKLRQLRLPIPCYELQQLLVDAFEMSMSRNQRLQVELELVERRVSRLKRVILEKAFEGHLMPQNIDDDPASVLVEQIKAKRAALLKAERGRRTPKKPEEQGRLL